MSLSFEQEFVLEDAVPQKSEISTSCPPEPLVLAEKVSSRASSSCVSTDTSSLRNAAIRRMIRYNKKVIGSDSSEQSESLFSDTRLPNLRRRKSLLGSELSMSPCSVKTATPVPGINWYGFNDYGCSRFFPSENNTFGTMVSPCIVEEMSTCSDMCSTTSAASSPISSSCNTQGSNCSPMTNNGVSAQYTSQNTLPIPGQAPASYCGNGAASPVVCNDSSMPVQFPQSSQFVGQQQADQFQQGFQTIGQQPAVQQYSSAALPSTDALQQAQMAFTIAQNMSSLPLFQNTVQSNAASGTWTTQFNGQMGTFVPVFVPDTFTSSVSSGSAQETVAAMLDVQEEASETSGSTQSAENKKGKKSKKNKGSVAEPVCYKVFVGGLMPLTNSSALKEHFSKYGKVVDVNVVLDKETKKNRGFGYVQFETDVIASLLKDQHIIDDRKCSVRPFSSACTPNKTSKKYKEPVARQSGYKLFVGGLMPFTNGKALTDHFSKYGKILDVNVVIDKETKKNRGFGYVEFEKDVIGSLLTDDHVIDGRKCGVRRYAFQC